MLKRIGVIILVLFILIFSIDQQKKEAQAFVPVIAYGLSYVMAAMVAAGVVGYCTQDAQGNWGGNLYVAAKNTYDSMSASLRDSLESKLALSSFLTMSAVPGLWNFLHGKFLADSMVPKTELLVWPADFPGYQLIWQGDSTYVLYGTYPLAYFRFDTFSYVGNNRYMANVHVVGTPSVSQAACISIVNFLLTQDATTDGFQADGTLPATFPVPVPRVSDGDETRTINIAANPLSYNQATPSTLYPDRNGIPTTSVPTSDVQNQTGSIDADRAAQAAAAAAAAIAAALAAGHSQTAADAAGAAAAAAIYAGQTAAQAAAAAATAAIAYVTSTTGALTTDIANSKPTDTIDWTPLKLSLSAFTTKFPFSLPWDLQNMVTTFGVVPAANTPSFSLVADSHIPFGFKINTSMDLSKFNGVVATVRAFEKIIFLIGLMLGTRKMLGGAS